MDRLTLLARTRLSARLATRIDPEDVVMSAWRSFFLGARNGRFALQRSGDLWRLLVSITLHKLYRQARRQSADKRSVAREVASNVEFENYAIPDHREPMPDEAIALADELQTQLELLEPFSRRVVELRLQGMTLEDIAADTHRSERTVRRTLESLRQRLTSALVTERDRR
jgi:RNA polymerase sigma factor (sigma-70 family)